jgi:hypothetical protein
MLVFANHATVKQIVTGMAGEHTDGLDLPICKLVFNLWNYTLAEAQPPWHNSANKTQV